MRRFIAMDLTENMMHDTRNIFFLPVVTLLDYAQTVNRFHTSFHDSAS